MQTLLAIDQGTTSTRSILFDEHGMVLASAQAELKQYYPQAGWVEHDPEEIWQTTLDTINQAVGSDKQKWQEIAAMGISNQRETTILWHRDTGEAIARAVVWQDRRTASICQTLIAQGVQQQVQEKTGLLIDPYFCATKIQWLLDNIVGARQLAQQGKLAFGTVDSYLIWRLSSGQRHVTDATNASRTLLFNIHTQTWDPELLTLFNIPQEILPEVLDSSAEFATTATNLLPACIPITGVAGDQQAAAFGQACFYPGMVKSTYGTGCFVLLNTGEKILKSEQRLLSTVSYRLQGKPSYGLEGSIFVAGAAVQWLRDAVKLIAHAQDTEQYAMNIEDTGGVYLVPAFTGLGAPYWDPDARGAILGLTRDSGVDTIVRAALEAVCYQTKDLLRSMQKDGAVINSLRVDGGMVVNDWLMQFLADILNITIERSAISEASALGAAYLAGLQVGVFSNLQALSNLWRSDCTFQSQCSEARRETLYEGWLQAVARVAS